MGGPSKVGPKVIVGEGTLVTPSKPGEGIALSVPDRWGTSSVTLTVYTAKPQKRDHPVAVSELSAKLLHTMRAKTPGTAEYYAKQGLMRVHTQGGVAFLSRGDLQKAIDAGVKWNHVNIEDAVKLAEAEGAAHEQQAAVTDAQRAAKLLKKKGIHGGQKAGHRGPRNLEEYKKVLQEGIKPLNLPQKTSRRKS